MFRRDGGIDFQNKRESRVGGVRRQKIRAQTFRPTVKQMSILQYTGGTPFVSSVDSNLTRGWANGKPSDILSEDSGSTPDCESSNHLMRGRVEVTHQPHKLFHAGSSPAPATSNLQSRYKLAKMFDLTRGIARQNKRIRQAKQAKRDSTHVIFGKGAGVLTMARSKNATSETPASGNADRLQCNNNFGYRCGNQTRRRTDHNAVESVDINDCEIRDKLWSSSRLRRCENPIMAPEKTTGIQSRLNRRVDATMGTESKGTPWRRAVLDKCGGNVPLSEFSTHK